MLPIHRRLLSNIFAITLLIAFHSSTQAQVNPQVRQNLRATHIAQAYARTNNLPLRKVECGPECRRIRRVFVPVTDGTWNSFFKHFNESGNFMALRYTKGQNHVAPNFAVDQNGAPQDCYLWAINYNREGQFANGYTRSDLRHYYMTPNYQGWIAAVDLSGGFMQHLRQYLNNQDTSGNRADGHCMEWLANAPVAPDKSLFHLLGIHRSRDAAEIAKKFVHSANQRVSVIGVRVDNIEDFTKMSNQDLIGPLPHKGVDAAAILP